MQLYSIIETATDEEPKTVLHSTTILDVLAYMYGNKLYSVYNLHEINEVIDLLTRLQCIGYIIIHEEIKLGKEVVYEIFKDKD